MNSVMKPVGTDLNSIPFQEASLDIWDKKYRLTTKDGEPLDRSMDETYKRVARALADVERDEVRERWYERFLWALRHGAIPAGRVTSNAGAWEHKPATSTINCTVSGAVRDSMDDILGKVHEAGLTLKAGCVAPGTWVRTERGLVTADEAVREQHREILCYDRDAQRFEMRPILRHLTTHVPREENIRIHSNGMTLTTSVRHPVLVYRQGELIYVRADELRGSDALVQRRLSWGAAAIRAGEAWLAGCHAADGSAYPRQLAYRGTRHPWIRRARALGQRLVFRVQAAAHEVIGRYALFFSTFVDSRVPAVPAFTGAGRPAPAWDHAIASLGSSRAVERAADRAAIGRPEAAPLDPGGAGASLPGVPGGIDRHRCDRER